MITYNCNLFIQNKETMMSSKSKSKSFGSRLCAVMSPRRKRRNKNKRISNFEIAFINNIICVLSIVDSLSHTQNIPKIISQNKYIQSELLAAQIILHYMNPGSITNPITVERKDICERWMIYTKYIIHHKNSKKASKLAKQFKCTLIKYKKS